MNDVTKAVDFVCHTDGGGYWSSVQAAVRCTMLEMTTFLMDDDEPGCDEFGELCVTFDTSTWNPNTVGLIYTDRRFEQELHAALNSMGLSKLATDNVWYSEQGMQGDDYVSFDVGMVFIAEFRALFGVINMYESCK